MRVLEALCVLTIGMASMLTGAIVTAAVMAH